MAPHPTEEVAGSQAAGTPLQVLPETYVLFTEAQELRSGEQSQAGQDRRNLRKLGTLGEGGPYPIQESKLQRKRLGSRSHVFSWGELREGGGSPEALQ